MANFCTKCGRPLPESGICEYCKDTNTAAETMNNEEQMQGQSYQEQPQQNQYQQQPYQGQNQQQGSYQGPYQQQGPYQGSYQQQGPYQGPYQQQGPYNGGMSREAEWFYNKKDMLVSGTKNMFSEILPVMKAPVTRVKEIAATGSPAVGLEFIIAKAAVVILIILVAIAKLRSGIGFVDNYVSIPYLRILFITILLTVGVDCIEALLLKVFTGVFNGKTDYASMITVVGARAMYQGAFFLICALLLLLSPGTASIMLMIGMIISPYIEFGGYMAVAKVNPDRKPYVFLIINICMILLLFVFGYIFASDLVASLPNLTDIF